MKPSAEHVALAEIYELHIHREQRQGRNGEVLGRGAGTSTDFLDHRPYNAGDDIRRIDWGAYARTDQLLLKRFQEEIRPMVEIWLDNSASMCVSEDKAQLALDLGCFFSRVCQNVGIDHQIRVLGEGKSQPDRLFAGDISFAGTEDLGVSIQREQLSVTRGAHVIVLSDFLSAHDPQRVVSGVMHRAATMTVIQILAAEDLNIEEGSSILLQDSESGEMIEIDLDAASIASYHRRLTQLQDDLERELFHRGGHLSVWPVLNTFQDGLNQLVAKGVLSLSSF